jgi:hypothetical protein
MFLKVVLKHFCLLVPNFDRADRSGIRFLEPDGPVADVLACAILNIRHDTMAMRLRLAVHLLPRLQEVLGVGECNKAILGL